MKILSAAQIREADQFTVKNEPISPLDLMERASKTCLDWISKRYTVHNKMIVICGTGNNGGDGLALARMLHQKGYYVEVYAHGTSSRNRSFEFDRNETRLKNAGLRLKYIKNEKDLSNISLKNMVVVDALFGSGINRPVEGFTKEIIQKINHSGSDVISIDLPSGLFAENNEKNDREAIVQATHCLTFQVPKLALLLPENERFTGEMHTLDIGLSQKFIDEAETRDYFFLADQAAHLLKQRTKFSHKGNYGHSLIIAGSKGKMGAGVLSAKACLRTGSGLVSIHVPSCGTAILQTALPEAIVIENAGDNFLKDQELSLSFDSIGIGPGIGQDKETEKLLTSVLERATSPLVLDADALNILSNNKSLLAKLPKGTILTPHPKEFERMTGSTYDGIDQIEKMRELASKYEVIVILKGAHSRICPPDGTIYFNSNGNPGMATAGTGDILTGMITSLLSQGYLPENAARLGVFMHGLAGDLAIKTIPRDSLIASDLFDYIGHAWKTLRETK
jgi:hydroxyethylthiazole kinase-like uncharacterized protein yjeF